MCILYRQTKSPDAMRRLFAVVDDRMGDLAVNENGGLRATPGMWAQDSILPSAGVCGGCLNRWSARQRRWPAWCRLTYGAARHGWSRSYWFRWPSRSSRRAA
jgi:hypothetical protein